jgi:NAD(P)-dependent dehydrogenase (short-subunit alcohol dehydrogenase family)
MTGTHVIYGAVGGIGEATARLLARQGARLHLSARNAEALAALAAELGAGFTAGDVLEDGFPGRVAAAAGEAVSSVVYAVGTINLKPLGRLTKSDFINDFSINALGAASVVQAHLASLKAAPGTASVVFFSTVAVAQGFTAHASVSMAKGAVEGLTKALAAELAPKIRVNAIAPSLTRTPLARALTAQESMASAIAGLHALQRLGEAEDVARLAAFLASDQSDWITGQVIGVDGGRSSLRTKG